MNLHIQYITDIKGSQQAVIIPQKEWISFEKEFHKLRRKLDILLGIETAMREVRLIQTGKKKGKTLKAFLNEV